VVRGGGGPTCLQAVAAGPGSPGRPATTSSSVIPAAIASREEPERTA
jgi:hypothetical protein